MAMLQNLCKHSCCGVAAKRVVFFRSLGRNAHVGRAPVKRWSDQYQHYRPQRRGLSAAAVSVDKVAPVAPFDATSAKDLPKNFDPQASEEKIYQWWESSGFFQPDMESKGEPYVVPMPPPNVTGRLHMGHAMFVTLQDIMVRFARMRGRCTLWIPGTDHAGIATQMVVEKMLNEEGLGREELGREKFVERVWDWKAEYGGYITRQMRRLGASCDWTRERFTLDEGLSGSVVEAFVRLHEKGLIYKGSYMVNWAPKLRTAVSDLEVEYTEEQGTLYYFKYPLHDSSDHIPVATTRPETILGDTAVAVHPEDDRYKHLIGKECIVPTTGRRIKVVGDEYVDREFGTGALKITPGHDPNDYEIGKRLDLDIINIMNKDATLNENAGDYAGMDRFEARKALWADMEKIDLVIKKEPYQTRVPRSQRGGEVIEPLVSDQWFVRMEGLAKPALDAVASGEVKIMPERYVKVFNRWLSDIKDWCISRQLWWGHRIPVWYVRGENVSNGGTEPYIVARNETEALQLAVEKYGEGVTLEQEVDVLDTWFSSGLWPFSTLGWPDESESDLQRFYPGHMLETAHDILFFWVARMVMMGIEFTGKAPFSTIYLHGLVRDDKGRKMSKSLGNVIDPLKTIEEVGADPLRFGLITGTAAGQDLNLSMERVMSARNFTNKLWNIGKFIGFNLPDDPELLAKFSERKFQSTDALEGLSLSEQWILTRLHVVIDDVTVLQEKYDLGEAGRRLYDFVWGDFADWFVEAAKTQLYGDDSDAKETSQAVLVYCYDKILKMLHPFMPYVTEELWQAMPHVGTALVASEWPDVGAAKSDSALTQFDALQMVVKSVRNLRAEYNVDLGRKVAATIIVQDEEIRTAIDKELSVLVALARLDPDRVAVVGSLGGDPDPNSVTCVVKDGIEVSLPMSGLFDAAKELDRLQKQLEKVEKELSGLQGRLNNEKFVANAAKDVVEKVRTQKREVEQQATQIQEKMAQMKRLVD
ncbi:hypothetical protein BSKO_00154 [Bryopsis sp. KO-2023]|nr:hypothetical protein BSKO_00154 [Bryopsis sp. KO-2023]